MIIEIPYLGFIDPKSVTNVKATRAKRRWASRHKKGPKKGYPKADVLPVGWPPRMKAVRPYEAFFEPEYRPPEVRVWQTGEAYPSYSIQCKSDAEAERVKATILGALNSAVEQGLETIVAAAVDITLFDPAKPEWADPPRAFTVSLPAPKRHHDIIHAVAEYIGRPVVPHEQGFLTSTGRFVGRKEAYGLALRAGQIAPKPNAVLPDLFSEDLW